MLFSGRPLRQPIEFGFKISAITEHDFPRTARSRNQIPSAYILLIVRRRFSTAS